MKKAWDELMYARIISAALKPHFWFARKQYCIVKADANDIINAVLAEPKISFTYHFISGLNERGVDEFDRVSIELSEFVPNVMLMTMKKALRSGNILVIARDGCSGEIAACRVCYAGSAERGIISLRDGEFYIGNAYTKPKYRGMRLQGITLQRGLVWMKVPNQAKRTAVAIVEPNNRASMRGLAKVGFRETGWLVERRVFRFARIIYGWDCGQSFYRLVFGNPL